MPRLKKEHREDLQSKDMQGFLKGITGLQREFGLHNFRLNLAIQHKGEDTPSCTAPGKWTWCDMGGGKLKQVCLADGEGCPPVDNGIFA